MEFSPNFPQVKRVNTNITNKHQKPELARKLLVLRRGTWHHNPPPHDFRQQYLQGFNTALTLSGIDPRIEPNQISHLTIECTSKNQKVPPALRWQQVNETNARLFDAGTASSIMVFNYPSLVFQSSVWQYRTSSAPAFNDILKKEKQKSSPGAKIKTETNQKPKPIIKEYSSQSYNARKMPPCATVWRESQHAASPTAHEPLETHRSLHSPFLHEGPDRREPLRLLALRLGPDAAVPPRVRSCVRLRCLQQVCGARWELLRVTEDCVRLGESPRDILLRRKERKCP